MRELTGKQQEVLAFIRTFVTKHGVPPTVREIGDRFKVTPRAAFDHLRALERKGALQRRASAGRTSRALTLTEPPIGFRSVVITRIVVVLPAPFGPSRPNTSPGATSKLTSSTARTGPHA